MDKKKKIWILTLSRTYLPDIWWIETHIFNLSNVIKKHQDEYSFSILCFAPIFYSNTKDFKKEEKDWNIFIKRISFPKFWVNFLLNNSTFSLKILWIYMLPKYFISLRKFLLKKKKEIDIIHIQWAFTLIAWVILAKIFKKKVIFSTNLMYRFHENIITRIVFWFFIWLCDNVLCVSELSVQEMKKLNIKDNKISRFVNRVDENNFSEINRNDIRSKLGLMDKDIVIFFTWRLIEEKGVWVALQAFDKLRKYKNIKLIISWDGEYKQKILDYEKNNKNIKYLWVLHWNENIEKFLISDIYLFPTLYKGEAQPLVLAESLMAGLPIICSDIKIVRTIFDIKKLYLIDPTVDNVVKAILYFYNNPDKILAWKNDRKSYAIANFGTKRSSDVLNIYKKLVE